MPSVSTLEWHLSSSTLYPMPRWIPAHVPQPITAQASSKRIKHTTAIQANKRGQCAKFKAKAIILPIDQRTSIRPRYRNLQCASTQPTATGHSQLVGTPATIDFPPHVQGKHVLESVLLASAAAVIASESSHRSRIIYNINNVHQCRNTTVNQYWQLQKQKTSTFH